MKEINIKFKTLEELKEDSSYPFIITIDGEVQKDVKRFAIDLDGCNLNLDTYSYLLEKYLKYPF